MTLAEKLAELREVAERALPCGGVVYEVYARDILALLALIEKQREALNDIAEFRHRWTEGEKTSAAYEALAFNPFEE
jgi:hypothetical protein